MRYKYIHLLLYLWLAVAVLGDESLLKKKSGSTEEESETTDGNEDEMAVKIKRVQEGLSNIDRLRSQIANMIQAPDLTNNDKDKKKDSEDTSDDDDFKIFYARQKRLLKDLGPGETVDETKGDDIQDQELLRLFLNKQKKLLRRMIAQVQGFGELEDVETDIEFEMEDEPFKMTESAIELEPPEPKPELTPEEQVAQDVYEKAIKMLSASRPRKAEAYQVLQEAANLGSVRARVMVAWAQLFGSPLPQDIPAANATFHELAETGVADAHMGVGFLYASGIAVNVSQARALVHYTFGALGGSNWALMALGYRHWAGVTVASNCDRALNYYRKVANKVAEDVSLSGGTAVQRVRLLEEAENPGYNSGILDKDLMEYYQLLAEKGDVQAQVGLGQLHYQGGRGVQQDLQRALHYFLQAADAGNAIAMAFLGKMYLEGSDIVKQDNITAFNYFKKAADLGNPVGQSGLGLMYLYGKGVVKDYQKAHKYFQLAADQGWVDGQLQLGNMYFGGQGVLRDYKAANKFFSLASQSGHVLAFYNLAQMHATGTGVPRSCATAVELYKNVAERGKWGERLMEAHTLQKEGRVNEAFVIYALLAELGYEVAQSNAAFLLDKGEVVYYPGTDRYVVGLMQWGRAASQGYSAAQVKLGDYHYYGLGTPVDYEMAATHYRLASDQQRNAQAMFNLGYMHEQGLGMQQDMHLAKRCYDLAAETSSDAKVPVALALFKLSCLFGVKYLKESKWLEYVLLVRADSMFGPNWDIFLGSFLGGVVMLILNRRRVLAAENQNA